MFQEQLLNLIVTHQQLLNLIVRLLFRHPAATLIELDQQLLNLVARLLFRHSAPTIITGLESETTLALGQHPCCNQHCTLENGPAPTLATRLQRDAWCNQLLSLTSLVVRFLGSLPKCTGTC